jgi:hypothetical protein
LEREIRWRLTAALRFAHTVMPLFRGTRVNYGDVIAYSGNSGNA